MPPRFLFYNGINISHWLDGDEPAGQQEGEWLKPRVLLADLFQMPAVPEIVGRLLTTIFQPRWPKGRWRSTT